MNKVLLVSIIVVVLVILGIALFGKDTISSYKKSTKYDVEGNPII